MSVYEAIYIFLNHGAHFFLLFGAAFWLGRGRFFPSVFFLVILINGVFLIARLCGVLNRPLVLFSLLLVAGMLRALLWLLEKYHFFFFVLVLAF